MLESGAVLFEHCHLNVKTSLFGGMMSALNTYANVISDGGLMSFELGQKRSVIHVLKSNRVLFIANCPNKTKEKKVRRVLEEIAEIFFQNYEEFSKDDFEGFFDGEISKFEGFGKEIEDLLIQK